MYIFTRNNQFAFVVDVEKYLQSVKIKLVNYIAIHLINMSASVG